MGFINLNGERFVYREVEWSEKREKAANIAANKGAGDWDIPKLTEWMGELKEMKFDLDLTMFDLDERKEMFPKLIDVSAHSRKKTDVSASKKQAEKFDHTCPKCNFQFNDANAGPSKMADATFRPKGIVRRPALR